ncbi:membrane protein [Yersinia intermedia]|uniref:Membrane protein n=1 Tax=Yersinia intermedia TaxID=631 RepID=A0A0T9LMW9_YERIN|nr:membrane protein [Yersinia intermedia]
MIESEMENKLLNKGFTAKNIAHMRKIISRDGTQKETYSSLLIDLKKRFFLRDV